MSTVSLDESVQAVNINSLKVISNIIYCRICTLPPEFCEYGTTLNKCKSWLEENEHPLYCALYSDLTAEEQQQQAKPDKEKGTKKVKNPSKKKVIITIIERTKRKRVTHIEGLELFSVDLKKAAKMFANKFATGSSVSKTGAGADEIVIQGDCAYEVVDYILENFKELKDSDIEIVEGKKK